jgi:hypothetical protein
MGVRRRESVQGRTPALGLPQHADEYRPEGLVLLAVDQEFAEGSCLGVAPVRADRIGPYWGGEHQDVEQLGAGSRPEGRRGADVAGARARRDARTTGYADGARVVSSVTGGTVNWLMRLSLVTFVVSICVWGVIAVWQTVRYTS